MFQTQPTAANQLTLDAVIQRLANHPLIDGLAFFGTPPTEPTSISDYDLLLLVDAEPVPIFQMLTYIDNRMADVVIYTTELADQVLNEPLPNPLSPWVGYLLQKMRKAQIVYDRSGRLTQVQTNLRTAAGVPLAVTTSSEKYQEWFWLNHTLIHLQRLVHSTDPIYQRAVELMVMGALATICRSYFRLHGLAWEGEKAALRYLQQDNPRYLALLDQALGATERAKKVACYAQLVAATLAGVGEQWQPGGTAVILRNETQQPEDTQIAVEFWESLLSPGEA